MKVTAIIQARMASSRLPGKVLMEVLGRPLLSYQIERLHFSERIDDIIIATTMKKEDDPLAELACKEGLKAFRGSEDDVLDRYYQVAKRHNAEHIMRLTADCPLVEPSVCDSIAAAYFLSGCDYVKTGETFAEGLDCEVFSFRALEKAWKNAKLKSEREHVTLYFRNQPELFEVKTINNETDDGKYRLTVEQEEDYFVVKAIIENLYAGTYDYIRINEVKSFLKSNPEIFEINRNILRNEGTLMSLDKDALASSC